eukprot:NODE_8282_length_1508_cov_1.965967.p1 GENE.NODE_8282_length_1508_cov_1.965967~~NODE_8282_length_1508_cov_1.965967.p1  ORF type:complete len:377 (-),score=131.12 NODE_8282_length_1508_cov_1.965967:321-1451(-)
MAHQVAPVVPMGADDDSDIAAEVEKLPMDPKGKYEALVTLPLPKVRGMLKQSSLLVDGSKARLVLRLVLHLAGLPAMAADAAYLEARRNAEAAAERERGEAAAASAKLRKEAAIAAAKAKKEAAAAAAKAAYEASWPRRCSLIGDKKVAFLPKPDIAVEPCGYLEPGASFMASGEHKDAKTNRRYLRLSNGRGWVPEHSRKDAAKKVLEEEVPKVEPDPEEAKAAAAKAAEAKAAGAKDAEAKAVEAKAAEAKPAGKSHKKKRAAEPSGPEEVDAAPVPKAARTDAGNASVLEPPAGADAALDANVGPTLPKVTDASVRAFLKEFICKIDINTAKLRDLRVALTEHFGPAYEALGDRVTDIAGEVVQARMTECGLL